MTGTRAAAVAADCAKCAPNAPLLGGVIYCGAKIALSNSLAAFGVFSLAYNRGKYGAFMHLSLSRFCPPELHCYAHCTTTGALCCSYYTADFQPRSYHTSPCSLLYCAATVCG
jgi:hypothetical protein